MEGLNELDVEGDWLVLRQVLWKVPDSLLEKSLTLKDDNPPSAFSSRKQRTWSLTDNSQQQRGEVREGGRRREGGGEGGGEGREGGRRGGREGGGEGGREGGEREGGREGGGEGGREGGRVVTMYHYR